MVNKSCCPPLRVLEKAIRRPSGEYSGALSSMPAAVRVKRVTPRRPSASEDLVVVVADPVAAEDDGLPVGDQLGVWLLT
jgi:hypothetical protein